MNRQNLLCAAALGLAPLPAATAMTLSVHADALHLQGTIERRDLDRITAALNQSPNIKTIVLRNSMGGNSWTGYRLGELFRERKLNTVVSGHCVSSCSRLFLGGVSRQFSNDFPPSLTYVGFHGHYDFGELNRDAVSKNDLIEWTMRHASGGLDRALVKRWSEIPKRAGDVRFYPAGARGLRPTVYCSGDEALRPQDCEAIATDGYAQGIVTTRALYRSSDADQLLYGLRQTKYPTREFQGLSGATKARVEKEIAHYQRAPLPRAFAVSPDGMVARWRGNSLRSAEDALAACNNASAKACRLYAVDDRY